MHIYTDMFYMINIHVYMYIHIYMYMYVRWIHTVLVICVHTCIYMYMSNIICIYNLCMCMHLMCTNDFQLSILVHPDKNESDRERAQFAFEGTH